MDKFWKWLMRANARGVFLGSLLGFLLTIGWWTYTEYRPRKRDMIPASGQRATMEAEPLGIGVFLNQEMQALTELTRGNPFFIRQPPHHFHPPSKHRDPEPEPNPAPPQHVTPVPPQPPQPQPEPEPEPEPPPAPEPVRQGYTIEYKGLFTRSDGSTAALLRDGKTGASSFYTKGALLHGMKVGRVTSRNVGIVRQDGSLVLLKLGEPEDF